MVYMDRVDAHVRIKRGVWEDMKRIAKHAGTSTCELIEGLCAWFIELYLKYGVYSRGRIFIVGPPAVIVNERHIHRQRRKPKAPASCRD